jgi:hypothetical protein
MQYDNTNKGSLWTNDKEGNAKRPDFTGVLNVEGKEYKISVWNKVSETPLSPVMGISIQPKEARAADPIPERKQDMTVMQQGAHIAPAQPARVDEQFDTSSIPF